MLEFWKTNIILCVRECVLGKRTMFLSLLLPLLKVTASIDAQSSA